MHIFYSSKEYMLGIQAKDLVRARHAPHSNAKYATLFMEQLHLEDYYSTTHVINLINLSHQSELHKLEERHILRPIPTIATK